MGTQAATIAHMLDTLSDLPLTSRRMFGEYALYLDGKTVAFVCDDTLFIKPTPGALAPEQLPNSAEAGPGPPRDDGALRFGGLDRYACIRSLVFDTFPPLGA